MKLCLLNFHVILPNATRYTAKLDKKILKSKTEAVVWRKSAGLQGWMNESLLFGYGGCISLKTSLHECRLSTRLKN